MASAQVLGLKLITRDGPIRGSSAVAVLWPSAMAARIGSTTAIATLTAAFNRAEESS